MVVDDHVKPESVKVGLGLRIYSSVQWHLSPTFSNSVNWNRCALRRALSSLPRQENSLAKPLRLRGATPSYAPSGEYVEVEDTGLKGIVALAKMSDS